MKKIAILFALFLTLNGCTIYSEKQSEAVSQSVYATKDSIDSARIDLAQQYINETTRIINPPKKRIPIKPIYSEDEDTTSVQIHSGKAHGTLRKPKETPTPSPAVPEKKKIVILPEDYKNDKVVTINSDEYKKLLEDKKVSEQLKWDYYNLDQEKKVTDAQIIKNKEINDKMVKDLNYYQKEVYKLRLSNLWRDIVIAILTLIIVGIVYIKVTKPISPLSALL
jgi:hypothetical protein